MRDRVPASGMGGRVSLATENIAVTEDGILKIADDEGILFGILGHADSATVAGSMYNKANVLPSVVTTALGINATTSEPKDAFLALNNKIKASDTNISKISNLVDGDYVDVAVSNYKDTSNSRNPNDYRTLATNKTDFLISCTALYYGSATLAIAFGNVIFTVDLPSFGSSSSGGSGSKFCRVYKSGGYWFIQYTDGTYDFKPDTNGSGSIVVKAYIVGQNYLRNDQVTSLSVKGR